jgi:VIT1/CCC1 family predicted Fe2+/Mn2+ transporter
MLIEAETQRTDLGVVGRELREISDLPQVRRTDSQLLSSSAPYLYLTGAFAAFFATLYVTDWFWVLPHAVLLSAAALHLTVAVKRKYRN